MLAPTILKIYGFAIADVADIRCHLLSPANICEPARYALADVRIRRLPKTKLRLKRCIVLDILAGATDRRIDI